jgi:uncharacterized membrane protein
MRKAHAEFMLLMMPAMTQPSASNNATDNATNSATHSASTTPDNLTQGTRLSALLALVALIVLGLAWELWLAPTGSGTLALKVLPLVFCVVGLMRHRMYTYRWLSLLVWLYFLEGVVRATSEAGVSRVLAVIEIALCLVLFGVCSLYIRWRLRKAADLPATEAR